MKKIRSTFGRYRLFSSVLALVLMLSALAVTPVGAGKICDDICSGWDVKNGCTTCNRCCVENGTTTCEPRIDNNCGTGGPGLAD